MKEQIDSNLNRILGTDQWSEEEVVYFLVEIYKLIEQQNLKENYKVLVFYRNWVCHSSLSSADKIFEDLVALVKIKKYLDMPRTWKALSTRIVIESFAEYSPSLLCGEINKFLTGQGLKSEISWKKFIYSMMDVLRDVPLTIKHNGTEIFRLTHVIKNSQDLNNKFVVNILADGEKYSLRMFGEEFKDWEIEYDTLNGRNILVAKL